MESHTSLIPGFGLMQAILSVPKEPIQFKGHDVLDPLLGYHL
jgi:hypothetical protein